jgi:anaerobic magnesium-protoporphyrin IX monomethyl ester cyclase
MPQMWSVREREFAFWDNSVRARRLCEELTVKVARVAEAGAGIPAINSQRRKVLIVDLNNFATFPTLAVGILMASLRNSGFQATLLSPLAHDVPASERERADTFADHLARRVHLSTWEPFRVARDLARDVRNWWLDRPHPTVISATAAAIEKLGPDIILLSAYLQHHPTAVEIGKLAQARGIPLLIGGPMFNAEDALPRWLAAPGLTALVGAEVDTTLPMIVGAACDGEDLLAFDGVALPDGRRSRPAGPLRALNETPVPDFTDFPWDRYRVRIVPIMTGRGCQWNRCTFCSDIISVNGRTFRTRSVDSVMHEIREQSRRHQTTNFLFLDLKLNSHPAMLRGITENIQRNARGAQWIGTVHVDQRKDNGLSRGELKAAAAAGMRRVSFGLESGSQRLLDAMDKGCLVEANSEFIRNAHEAGLSVRATMFKGFPGETAEDLEQTAIFLEQHSPYLDRIRFNEFSMTAGTPIDQAVREHPELYPNVTVIGFDHRDIRTRYANRDGKGGAYRKAKARVLRAVFEINRRRIRSSAQAFDGLM